MFPFIYYRLRGYRYKQDGTIENQDSFLKRMTGIFMLYIAVTVTVPRKNHLHPHGLRYAWKWLAATINLGKFFESLLRIPVLIFLEGKNMRAKLVFKIFMVLT